MHLRLENFEIVCEETTRKGARALFLGIFGQRALKLMVPAQHTRIISRIRIRPKNWVNSFWQSSKIEPKSRIGTSNYSLKTRLYVCCDFEHSPFFRITLQYQSNNTVLMLAFSNGSNITPTNRLNTPKRKKRTQGHPSYTSANYFWQKLAMSTISHYAKKLHALSHRWTRFGFFMSKSHTNQVSTTGVSECLSE